MTTIDKKYDIVLTSSPIDEVSGHLFECFDYYLLFKENGLNACILLFNFPDVDLQKLFEGKYNADWSSIKQDVMRVAVDPGKTNLIAVRDIPILIVDGDCITLEDYNIFFSSKKLFGFASDLENDYIMAPRYKGMVFLQDYRIYGKGIEFKSIDYVKKMPFRFYKQPKAREDQNIGLIYVNNSCRRIDVEDMLKWHKMSGCIKSIVLAQKHDSQLDGIECFQQEIVPLEDMMSKFDVYIYTPVGRKFDCSPRLLTECFMFSKRAVVDVPYFDIGLQTRLDDCKKRLQSLDLKKDDDIINILGLR